MAYLAAFSQFAFMIVVLPMAPDAPTRGFLDEELFEMALLAFQAEVSLHQRIAGFLRMIEVVPFPGLRGMAGFAFFTEMPLVIVVLDVTVIAHG